MRHFDLTPLLSSSVGFDNFSRILESAFQTENNSKSYPPYNIEKIGEDGYQITLAVAGFTEDDLSITLDKRELIISGKSGTDDDERVFLHQGIAGRAFERRFQLAEHVKVVGAKMENGLLHVALEQQVPEAMKPRQIEIASVGPRTKQLTN